MSSSLEDFVKSKENSGTRIINDAPIQTHATIAATGLGRSGTTMLARILHGIGLEMGPYCHPNTSDDKQIQKAMRKFDWGRFEEICRERDSQFDIWAFKDPKIRDELPRAAALMRNPRLIVTFRDLLAVSLRNEISASTEIWNAMRLALKGYTLLVEQLRNLTCPTLMLSYEKCLVRPEETVRIIADFCGRSLSDEDIGRIARTAIRDSDPKYLSYNYDHSAI